MRRFLALCVMSLAIACGGDGGDKAEGEPCTRTAECMPGLRCTAGICAALASDSGADGD
jgi:hypothetical protein